MTAQQCQVTYGRKLVGEAVRCTFIDGHEGPCSWQDLLEADSPMQSVDARTAMDVASLVMRGDYDPYLELLLNAAHNRKRALRGVRGFDNR